MITFHVCFTYFLSSFIVFMFLLKYLKLSSDQFSRYVGYSAGLGPILIALLLSYLLVILPGHSKYFYIIIIYTIFFLLFALSTSSLRKINIYSKNLFNLFDQKDKKYCVILTMLMMMVLISIFLLIWVIPLYGNDQIDYLNVSQIIAREKNITLYPIIESLNHGGIIAPWTHPPGFLSIYTWSLFISESSDIARLVTPIYLLYTVLLILTTFGKNNRIFALLVSLSLISTPLYFMEAATNHIDSLRIYTFLLVILYLIELRKFSDSLHLIFSGVLMGACLFSHSLGVLAIPIFSSIFFLISRNKHKALMEITVILSIGLLMVLYWYVKNYLNFGSIIDDNTAIWKIENIDYKTSLNLIRGYYSTSQIWLFGLLKGLLNIKMFGISYWLMMISLFLFIKHYYRNFLNSDQFYNMLLNDDVFFILVASSLVAIIFYGAVIATLLLGMNGLIKNDRYVLTIQPFISIIGTYAIFQCYTKFSKLNETNI